jgi:isoquinoline 1-oxidoreductase beta subunit
MSKATNFSRRNFLKVSITAGGGLAIGFYFPGLVRQASAQARAFAPNIWVRISPDDTVTIMISALEMGQGVMTGLPMVLAEELDADWSKVKLEWVGADKRYGNPAMRGAQATTASQSVRGLAQLLRQAGAAARLMLRTAAGQTWGVPENTLTTEKGTVIHAASGRRARYGELVEKAAAVPVPKDITLKDPKNFSLLGKSIPRVDIPEKVNGSAKFGMDVRLPDMLFARVLRCPTFKGKIANFDASKTMAIPGVRHVFEIGSIPAGGAADSFMASTRAEAEGVAVVADNFWAANQGVKALDVQWDDGPLARLTSEEIRRQMADACEKPGAAARNQGDFDKAWATAAKKIDVVYEVPYLAHATMEPMNCVADVRQDGCDVWVSTQTQTFSQEAAMKITGLPAEKVKVHTMYVGGGFGRRGEGDFVAEAVEISKSVGRPVHVIWTREDDIQHDYYRPVTYLRYWAALDQSGMPTGWKARLVQSSLFARFDPHGLDQMRGVDPISIGGIAAFAYNIPNARAEYVHHDPGIPFGFWRAPGGSVSGFMTESFADELAVAAGKDPFEFRRGLLGGAPRLKNVLELAAEKAGWAKPLPAGRFRGIAAVDSIGSFVAQVAEVSIGADGAVRVHRVVSAVDCGWVINPDSVKAQIEGGTLFGLTAALYGEITIRNGQAVQSNFNNYPMLRMNEAPEVEVHIVPSTEAPGGIGEAATPVIAPAVANAIYAATGKRIRRLPFRAADLKKA